MTGDMAKKGLSMSDHDTEDRALVERLRQAAVEIAREGHDGWGNACTWAADALARRIAEGERRITDDFIDALLSELDGIARMADSYDYGLPFGDEEKQRLREAVRQWVAEEPPR